MKKIIFALIFALIPFAANAKEAKKADVFYFFYSATCPHCHEAQPFVEELEKEYPGIEFRKLELSASPENQAIFKKKLEQMKIKGSGVPTFIFKEKYIVGFRKGLYEEKIRAMIAIPAKKAVPE